MQSHAVQLGTTDQLVRQPGLRLLRAAFYVLVILVGCCIVALSEFLLPARFLNDAGTIQYFLNDPNLWRGLSLDGFVNTARAWDVILTAIPLPEKVIVLAGYLCFAAFCLRQLQPLRNWRWDSAWLATAWLLCAAVFLAQLSKELVAIPVALSLCLSKAKPMRLAALILMLFYAAFFRQYWAIVLFYFVAFQFLLRRKLTPFRLLLALGVMFFPFALAQGIGYPPLSDARLFANADRIDDPDARTAFTNIFQSANALEDFGNSLYALLYLNFPIVLLKEGAAYYKLFCAFQIASVVYFLLGVRRILGVSRQRPSAEADMLVRCAAFVFAYACTLAIFEPDFGSFLRHQVVMTLPMLMVATQLRRR